MSRDPARRPSALARLQQRLEPAAALFLILNLVVVLAAGLGLIGPWHLGFMTPAILSIALNWRNLSPTAQRLVLLALGALALGAIGLAPHWPALTRASQQGANLVALMSVLGIFRRVLTPLDKVTEAFGVVLSQPPRLRFGLAQYAAHFFALLINLSVIPLFGALSARRGQQDQPAAHDAVVLGAMRGATMVALWSPFSVGFAVISQSIPTLDPVLFMVEAGLFAFAILWLSAHFHLLPAPLASPRTQQDDSYRRPTGRESRAVLLLGGLAAAMILLLVLLHEGTGIAFGTLSIMVICLSTLGVVLATRGAALDGQPPLRVLRSGANEMANEGTVIAAAAMLGAELSVLLNQTGALDTALTVDLPVALTMVVMVVIAGLVAMAWVPTAVMVVTLAQMLGNTPVGLENPQSFALTLGMCWIVSVLLSPVSGMSIVTARVCGVSTMDVIYRWNRGFTALVVLTGCAFIWLIAVMGL